jgi:ribosome maturation factor RimP
VPVEDQALEREIESRVESLGFELVDVEVAGSKTRPILRLRIDRTDSTDQSAVSLEDCTRVSRAVESFLDENEDLSERYVLEVSSPGVERPLVKPRDFERFAGKEVSIKTSHAVGDRGKRIDGVLVGLKGDEEVEVKVGNDVVSVKRSDIKKAHLVYKWEDNKKK